MKLLLDQNISYRVIKKIESVFPESQQVKRLGLDSASDIEIWMYAKIHNYTIVTFDADFYDISSLKGHPPKIVWLRFGNNTSSFIAEKLLLKEAQIQDFLVSKDCKDLSCLELN